MTAVLWKEIRENLKWAVLWLLGVAAATAYVFYVPQAAECWRNAESLCKPTFLMVMLFGAAAGGALLGLLQTAPETRRDRWAFLIHRPATRTRLFLGKVFGGLLLLLPAMGIPLVGAALWAATPGPPSSSSWARHCGRSQRTGGRTIPPWAGSSKPPSDRRQQVPASATGELFMSGRPTICPHAQLVEKEHQGAMERPLGVKRTSKPLTAYGLPASVCTCRAKG